MTETLPERVWLRVAGGGVTLPSGKSYTTMVGDDREMPGHKPYVRVDAKPSAWMVKWSDVNGNHGVDVCVDEKDARRAAENIEAYFTVKATATVTPLFASSRSTGE